MPLTVVSVAPSGSGVSAGAPITVQFSTDLAPDSPLPTLSPPVAGTWAVLSPSLLQYQATGPLVPGTTYGLEVDGHGCIVADPDTGAVRASAAVGTGRDGSVLGYISGMTALDRRIYAIFTGSAGGRYVTTLIEMTPPAACFAG